MADSNTWICSNCRSINEGRSRCYSCRAPRTLELDLSDTSISLLGQAATRSEDHAALAERAGEQYRSSAVRAWIVRLAILAVVLADLFASARIIHIGEDFLALQQRRSSGGVVTDADWLALLQDFYPYVALLVVYLGAWVIATICWGAWLSRVVANVPSLGGGWPATSPTAAFWTSVVPFFNIYGATSVLRDVITRLSPKGEARTGRLTAWWLSLFLYLIPWIGLIPGPTFVIRLAYQAIVAWIDAVLTAVTGTQIGAGIIESAITFGILLLSAVLALLVVEQVEELQERRRGIAAGPARAAGQAG